MEINKYILENYFKVEQGEISLENFTDEINKKFKTNLSMEAVRGRKKAEYKKQGKTIPTTFCTTNEYQKVNGDGSVEALRLVSLTKEEKDNPEAILRALEYNPDNIELVYAHFSEWQQHTKLQTTKQLYAVRYKIKPKFKKEVSIEEAIKIAKEVFAKEIKPLKLNRVVEKKGLDSNKLMENSPIELHLGKLSCHMNTGENYDQKIAQQRFRHIIQELAIKQEFEKCGTLLLNVGGDFFNSDNNFDTTNKGTQMHSDIRSTKMFLVGLELWKEALTILREKFDNIDIQLIVGNHDKTTSTYLFIALQQAFLNDKKINFINDYKEVQCYVFRDCGIWTTHGTKNINKTMDSIVSEFAKEYGATKYRELHTAHLHTEQELKERLGMIPRRTSSAGGKDEYEYDERYGNSIQKQEVFIWQGNKGIININMIPFEPVREEQKEKIRR